MTRRSRERTWDGVAFIHEDDGSVTARDIETGLARGGATRADALAQLADVLRLDAGNGEIIEDPDRFLTEAMAIDPAELESHEEPPGFLQE